MAVFENYDSNTLVSGSSDNDSIYNSGKYVTMTGGAGDDTIYNDSHYIEDGMYVTMLGGAGNDSINNAPYYANVSDVTINVGAGDDIITLGENSTKNLIKYTEGNGNDKIIGFNADSTLQIGENADGTYYSSKSGGNIIVTVGDSKITLIGAANLDTLNIQGIKKSVSNTLTLTNSSKAAVTINSAIKNVKASSRTKKIKIVGNTLDNSILGGKNSDTIYGCE